MPFFKPFLAHVALFLFIAFVTQGTVNASGGMQDQFHNPTFISVKVENIGEYKEWLQAAFGVKQVKEIVLPDAAGQIIILRNQALVFEVLALNEEGEAGTLGLFKAGIQVRDADIMFDQLHQQGAELITRVFEEVDLGVRSFVMKGPEGNFFQIWQHDLSRPAN